MGGAALFSALEASARRELADAGLASDTTGANEVRDGSFDVDEPDIDCRHGVTEVAGGFPGIRMAALVRRDSEDEIIYGVGGTAVTAFGRDHASALEQDGSVHGETGPVATSPVSTA